MDDLLTFYPISPQQQLADASSSCSLSGQVFSNPSLFPPQNCSLFSCLNQRGENEKTDQECYVSHKQMGKSTLKRRGGLFYMFGNNYKEIINQVNGSKSEKVINCLGKTSQMRAVSSQAEKGIEE